MNLSLTTWISSPSDSRETSALEKVFQRSRFLRFLPLLLCGSYTVFALFLGRHYAIGTYENADFYSRYAPDADRIARGFFPTDSFTGPGYALILRIVNPLFGNYFQAGRWIAAVAGGLCGLVAFNLFRRLFGVKVAFVALVLLFAAAEYSVLSIDPGSDLVFLLMCLCALSVFTNHRLSTLQRSVFPGIFAGYAYLTRYNGVFLPATFVVVILLFDCFTLTWKERVRMSAIHGLTFLLVASPWLWLNYRHRGSPFYNTNYLNIATYFFGYSTDSDGVQQAAKVFKGFGDVLTHDPSGFITHYLRSLVDTVRRSLYSDFLVIPIGILGLLTAPIVLLKRFRRNAIVLLVAGGIYALVMSLNHWENRYYLFVKVLYIGFAAFLVVSVVDWMTSRGWLSVRLNFAVLGAIVLTLASFSGLASGREARSLVRDQPVGLREAASFLKSLPKGVPIVSRKPHLPYLGGHPQQSFPVVNSVDELRTELSRSSAQYLVFDEVALALRPNLKMLGDPNNGISWLHAEYVDIENSLVVYRVMLAASAG